MSELLTEDGCNVLQAKKDQNLIIAETATEMALTNPIMVTADDMEIIIILCYCFRDDGYDVIYKNEECSKKPPVFYSIQSIRNKHERQVIDNIYFLHAIGGSKTTSHIHNIGKGQPLKEFSKSSEFRSIAGIFSSQTSTVPQIIDAGFRAPVMLYDGKIGLSLDAIRLTQLSKKVATKKIYSSGGSHAGAAKYHILRVYFQVQQWLGNQNINAENYGWRRKSTINDCYKLSPTTTDMDPAVH